VDIRHAEYSTRRSGSSAPAACYGSVVPVPAYTVSAPTLAVDLQSYIPIGILVVMAILFVVVNLVGTHLLGPRKATRVKGITYESGMNPIGTARKRFNIRFYILAMTFLVFDVEIIFLYPWALTFAKLEPQGADAGLFLARILFFLATSVIAYVYAWRKGVFRFD
jgi:NADH-quinone oxidoreductase subunit A